MNPAAFALHKLLIVPRRTNAEKKQKDFGFCRPSSQVARQKG
ncbi:MAG TPA: hypothetical protein DCZ95_19625 [Verrucomicrobia bacterium]|nr:hypothetical protein [Verrucomicrobiota bacterium]